MTHSYSQQPESLREQIDEILSNIGTDVVAGVVTVSQAERWEAGQALLALIKQHDAWVIGKDVEPHRLVNDRLSMAGDVENERNILRAEQRKRAEASYD